MDRDTLADVAQHLLGAPASRYLHAGVSGYKESTAFIVWIEGARGHPITIFFKDVKLDPDHYPGVVDFPGEPGFPEIALYTNPGNALMPFLPRVHMLAVLEPQMHYQYFMEDLNATHRRGFDHDDVLWAVERLFEVSAGIADWVDADTDAPTIRYDRDFPTSFIEFSHDAFTHFAEVTGNADTLDLLERWDAIASVYLDETPDTADDFVHGDFHKENMFHNRTDPTRLTVVDWEFMGVGWIHNDLVSLLKRARPETVDAALLRTAELRPNRTLEEHWRLYQRCRLERGLLDGAIVANQRLAASGNPTLSAVHFRRISDAYRLLITGDPRVRQAPPST